MNKVLDALGGGNTIERLHAPAVSPINAENIVRWFRSKQLTKPTYPFAIGATEGLCPNAWLSCLQDIAFQKSIIDEIDSFSLEMFYEIGYTGFENTMLAPFKSIAAMIPERNYIDFLVEISKLLQSLFSITIAEAEDGRLRLRYHVEPDLNEYLLGGLAFNVTGFVGAALSSKYGVACDYRVVRCQTILENVVHAAYERYGLSYAEKNDDVYIDGKIVGNRIQSPDDAINNSIRITSDFFHKGARLLKKDLFFDAPYCESEFRWKRRPFDEVSENCKATICISPQMRISESKIEAHLGGIAEGRYGRSINNDHPVFANNGRQVFLLKRTLKHIKVRKDISTHVAGTPSSYTGTERVRQRLVESGLTKREIEVALLLEKGASRKKIAARLGIAVATAKRHIENIYYKLDVRNRFDLHLKYGRPHTFE